MSLLNKIAAVCASPTCYKNPLRTKPPEKALVNEEIVVRCHLLLSAIVRLLPPVWRANRNDGVVAAPDGSSISVLSVEV